jgi:hypothetical protein
MSLSYTLDHIIGGATVEDVSVEVAPKSEMVKVPPVPLKDGRVETKYRLASGSDVYPAYITYSSEIQNRKALGSIRNIVIDLSTWATQTDSVSGLETKMPIQGMIVLNLPAGMTIEVADLDDFVGNLFSYLYPSVTAKVRSTTWLQNFIYGIPTAA